MNKEIICNSINEIYSTMEVLDRSGFFKTNGNLFIQRWRNSETNTTVIIDATNIFIV